MAKIEQLFGVHTSRVAAHRVQEVFRAADESNLSPRALAVLNHYKLYGVADAGAFMSAIDEMRDRCHLRIRCDSMTQVENSLRLPGESRRFGSR
ncbi:MAG: hypothetical protein UU73_C0001G0026 [Candidatus Daviesbacteria bacterium GW2011_GWA1_41_61]|uniref:Uncharacterized protein n=1 Tax=Candidatus Daviesbacteria bacterium GW2011_GWA2_40_9 TaxID=1618424 RepID=A0A0G0X5J3_9BACT|nr:MAG: hypothetical protein UU26_C0002G0078 [Candidatus Daviesbacteria bacterium GW2011_GWC1_40_9]KKR82917.1 MAG: hypothetical protein UU29_C0008G0026 [Candidatus Daviesbacteria bacterium GW2011_GWA2_40_9]KKR92845.1 MAG: hypothetical protein UU44_C0004G0027 [Candidatus Daviesbacteria bacterium GW2011_GWB1_41_15]KKS15389.1 MAG: hypothetical protein UU73_C0001G0026 [Candidatus Daviesbacteria bacterium GW2011_GWA1_41_61]